MRLIFHPPHDPLGHAICWKTAGRDFSVKVKTHEELAGFIRAYCDLTEREPGLFVVSEASTQMGVETPEKLIDLR